jgi:hypothetical protein
MRKPLSIALSVVLLVAACQNYSTSRLNPVNWFSGSTRVETMAPPPEAVADPRPLVDQVLTLVVEPTPGGAIVRATGLPPTQGWWQGQLVPEDLVEGRQNFRFVIIPPLQPTRVSTQPSREVTVGFFLPNSQLAQIREITVTGARNARSSRR